MSKGVCGVVDGDAEHWIKRWARWMASDRDEIERDAGWPTSSVGFSCGGSSSEDAFDHLVDSADMRMIKIVDSAVGQLDGPHYCAIANRWLASVWRFRGDREQIYQEAVGLVWAFVVRRV